MRQAGQSMQEPATEVHRVELRLVGRMGGGQGGHDRAEQRALPGPRRPDHRQVPGSARQVQDQRLLDLSERPVDHPDRHPEPSGRGGLEQPAEADLGGQWRKPHLMDRLTSPDEAADQDVEVGAAA